MTPKPHKADILVIDDDRDVIHLTKLLLSREGYRVFTASKVSEALHKAEIQPFHCILLDLQLEQGSGERVLNHIKETKSGFNLRTPVILMSSHLTSPLVNRAVKSVAEFLIKPIDKNVLLKKVRDTLIIAGIPPDSDADDGPTGSTP